MIILGHILRRGFRSVRENAALNAVSSLVIGVALLLLGVYLTLQSELVRLVHTWGQDAQVSAYFAAGTPPAERDAVLAAAKAVPGVLEARLISEAEAQAWLSARVEGMGPLLGELGADVLPASLEVRIAPGQGPATLAALDPLFSSPVFTDVDAGRDWIERLDGFLGTLKLMGAVLGSLILVAGLFLTSNTVNLVVFARRDELEVQRLVGATPAFIAGPFLVEGFVQGVAGGLLAVGGLELLHRLLLGQLRAVLVLPESAGLGALPGPWLLGLVLLGAVLGTGAALVAVLRFLLRAP
jgi:cell division transport system permease protein